MKRRLILVTVVVLTVVVVASWARQQMGVESRDQPVTEDDLRILQRADSLLKDVSVWNRHDDRACADDEAAGKWSLFCALQKADREILGEYQHRNVALQEVRFAIQDATRDRQTEMVIRALRQFSLPHRLMDFNNLPETRFEDVKQVLRVATERVGARLNRPKQQGQGHLPPPTRPQSSRKPVMPATARHSVLSAASGSIPVAWRAGM